MSVLFTRHLNDPLGPTWTMSGPGGAIVFSPMGIDIHSPEPMFGREEPSDTNCPVQTGPCWHDGSSLEGRKLRDRWERAEFNDDVIRAELRDWYRQFLAKEPVR